MLSLIALCLASTTHHHIRPGQFSKESELIARLKNVAPDPAISKYFVQNEPALTHSQLIALARKKIKHVFIIYQENESFDHYFGTFPGADGIFSLPASETPGYSEPIIETDGSVKTIHPFRMDPKWFPADTDDVDHGHKPIIAKMHIVDGIPQMDRFAEGEEHVHYHSGNPTLRAVQYGELAMGYVDGNTIPLLWRYANRFVLGDHIFQTIAGPSTPGNLSIFAGQTGATQWMLHPEEAFTNPANKGAGVPVVDDHNPYWGSAADPTQKGKMPYSSYDNPNHVSQLNLTFANIAYSLSGGKMGQLAKTDRNPQGDLADTMDDIRYLTKKGQRQIPWRWFEEGFDKEPTDVKSNDPVDANGTHASYITHHNGPQYFGSISNNPAMSKNLLGLNDFYQSIQQRTLPSEGVFYIKGGAENLMHLHPYDPDPAVQKSIVGDDDHPGYSDSQISEAMVARTINAIAKSPYWKNSVIIVAWDDSEGDYDHVAPPLITTGPDGKNLSDGPRIPFLFISPFSRTHYVFHEIGTQVSVIKFVDQIFNLTPLALLPNEVKGRKIGESKNLNYEGPQDALTPDVTDLIDALDPARLAGKAKPLPASYAIIPRKYVYVLPEVSGYGLKQLGIIPTDIAKGIKNHVPANFNPRPDTK